MEIKSTVFAVALVLIVTYRNMRVANLEGKKYRPYGLADLGSIIPESVSSVKDFVKLIKDRKKVNNITK